jgi:putative flippase GtrA
LFNVLTRTPFCWRRVPASLVSTSAGVGFGFMMNFYFVFQPQAPDLFERLIRFAAVTAFSCYVIQSAVILLGTYYSSQSVRRVIRWVRHLPGGTKLDHLFLEKNLIKGTAVLAGLIWNFSWYKFFVYAG